MKEKVKNFLKDGRGALIAIFVFHLILMFFITPNKYDDEVFLSWIAERSIPDIVAERYQIWTSRVIIETVLFTVLKISKYAWILIEALMITLLGYSISKIFIKKENKKELNTLLLFLILAYPMGIMGSAGWAATTVNYMWPIATAMFALIPLKKVWMGEKFKIYEYPLYILALLYGCNQEQTCAIVVGVYLLFTALLIIRDKKIHPFIVVQCILAIASMAFVLTAPGNYIRKNEEIITSFKDFEMVSFQDKISLGFTTTIADIIGEKSITFAILSLSIVVYVFTTYKEKIYRIVSLIPFVSICGLGIFSNITFSIFPFLESFTKHLVQPVVQLTAANCNNLFYVLPLVFAMVVFFSVILSLLLIFKNLKNNIAVVVFLVGLASRLIMGFSPSIFASSVRTIFYFDIAMMIVTILIWQELIKKNDKNDKKIQGRTYAVIKVTAVLQYINVLVSILLTQK